MTKQELQNLLQGIEWEDFEVKSALTELPKSIWETVSAFSNTSGGWIVLGVVQKGKKFFIEGLENPEKIESDFLNILRNGEKFNHVLTAKCEKFVFNSKTVLAFHIPSSSSKPIYFNSIKNSYIRSGSGDRKATESEIASMFREQAFGVRSEQPIDGTDISFFNESSLKSYKAHVEKINSYFSQPAMTMDEFCYQIGACDRKGKVTYAGLLFLGQRKHIDRFVPTFWMDYIEIPGETLESATSRYTFRIEPQENLWEYYRAILPRLRIFCNNEFHLNHDGTATDKESQFECMREALANMCMHTDFFNPTHSCIQAYSNRICFINAGSFAVSPQEQHKHYRLISRPRNPSIAKMFRLAKLAETVGFGLKTIYSWNNFTNNQVEIKSEIDCSMVIFSFNTTKKTTRKTTEKTTRKKVDDILSLIKNDESITATDIAKAVGLSLNGVLYHLKSLKKEGVITRVGTKGGYWIINQLDKNKINR